MLYNTLLSYDLVPEWLIRNKIKKLLGQRLQDEEKLYGDNIEKQTRNIVEYLKTNPIAINTRDANEQHYELPTEFFELILGPYMKYSSGYWENNINSLLEAECDMLTLTCQRADLKEGQNVLELGCGWGSLSLFMAENFPSSNFTVVSNSATQKKHIDKQIAKRELKNIEVLTADMNAFNTEKKFDRVVSVEMFEHMRNFDMLLERISKWLKEDGKLFVHIFTHHKYTYLFEEKDESDWMSKYFFTGGIMPGDNLLFYFDDHFIKNQHWRVNGLNYSKTAEAWLQNMNKNKNEIIPILNETYGKDKSRLWFSYWKIFFMSCSELWKYNEGNEWMVSHYLFNKK